MGPRPCTLSLRDTRTSRADKDTLWQVKTPEGDVWLSLVSMGKPPRCDGRGDTETACVETIGEALQKDEDFTQKINVGFLQALSRSEARLRVYERGAGETLACGTGACAAAVTGMRRGMFDGAVEITMHGGKLRISWGRSRASRVSHGPGGSRF